ncbi:MAG: DUF1571 domain-containing protein [Bacteroidia bacterium]|nr:DUF1571 domain-containing protein [Bacteroidia bacterium]
MKKMIAEWDKIKTMKFDLAMKERIRGKFHLSKSSFKLQYAPFKLYMKQDYPIKGMELLYVTGTNNNNVLVNPNGFPWANLNFDANNAHMRKDQHHSIYNSGFRYVYSIIEHLLEKYSAVIEKQITLDGNITYKNILCYKIIMVNPDFKYESYTLKSGESPFSVAKKFNINDYMVIDKNSDMKEFEDCKPGMTIKIPNDYAAKMEIWLDQKKLIPVIMKIYDDLGLYEEYEFSNVFLNYKFQSVEFTRDYKEYHF